MDFPWVNAALGFLVGAALYTPTLVIDLDSDRRAGYRTTAVILGRAATYWVGVGCFALACGLTVVLSALDLPFARSFFGFQVVAAVVQLAVYVVLMRRPSFTRIAVVSALFVVNGTVFLLAYVSR